MTAAQVQVAATALADGKRATERVSYQPGKNMKPGALPMRKQPRVPRSTMEELSKKVE